MPHRKLFNDGIRINVHLVIARQREQAFAGFGQRGAQHCAIFRAKDNIFQNRKIWHQFEVLKHHSDTRGYCGLAVGDLGLVSSDEHLAFISLIKSIKN